MALSDADPSRPDRPEPGAAGGHRPLKIGLVSDCYVPRLGRHRDAGPRPRPAPPAAPATRSWSSRRRPVPTSSTASGAPHGRARCCRSTSRSRRRRSGSVAELLEREQVDVAHFHGGIVSPAGLRGRGQRPGSAGIPTIITTHCLWSYATPAFRLLDRVATTGPTGRSCSPRSATSPRRRSTASPAAASTSRSCPTASTTTPGRSTPAPRDASVVTIVVGHAPGAPQAAQAPDEDDQAGARPGARRASRSGP